MNVLFSPCLKLALVFPDIGASHILTRCPGSLGIYLGLTGNRLGPQDAMKAGLVKYIVSSEQMDQLFHALSNEDLSEDAYTRIDQCIQSYKKEHSDAEISQIKP